MLIPGLKEYFEDLNYATSFHKGKYLMVPEVFHSIYKGALGEIAGYYILKEHNICLSEIKDTDFFEKFDFCLGDRICFDFKNWSKDFDKNKYTQLKWVKLKAQKCGYTLIFIINILFEGYKETRVYDDKEKNIKIVTIPWLYNSSHKNNGFNKEAILLIMEEISNGSYD